MDNQISRDFINQLIVNTAEAGLRLQNEDGTMPSGTNGPHLHKMTAARNTSHWSITFLNAFEISNQEVFRLAAVKCLEVLISPDLRPMGGAFWHRKTINKNSFNGLIGQSWSIEALYYGWKVLRIEKYYEISLDVFTDHVFDESLGLWYQLDIDGSPFKIENTLNQQIWLAAMGAKFSNQDNRIRLLVENFLTQLQKRKMVMRNGLFPLSVPNTNKIKSRLKYLINLLRGVHRRNELRYGYHLFTLCGLAQIYEVMPDHSFWANSNFQRGLNLPFSSKFLTRITDNKYAYSYNVPGFELPYIYSVFHSIIKQDNAKNISLNALAYQLGNHYDHDLNLLNRNTIDPETLAARFYEIYRIPDGFFFEE